ARLAVRLRQPKHLTPPKSHQCRGFRYFDPAGSQVLQHAHPVDLRPAHRNHRHRPKTPQPKPWRVTSLSGPKVTSLSGVYTALPRIRCYGTCYPTLSVAKHPPPAKAKDDEGQSSPAMFFFRIRRTVHQIARAAIGTKAAVTILGSVIIRPLSWAAFTRDRKSTRLN